MTDRERPAEDEYMTDDGTEHSPKRAAYVLEEFPKLSESFVIEEVNALHRKGAIADILSISRPSEISDRYPGLHGLTTYPDRSRTIRVNLANIVTPWWWKWFFRTLRWYPSKVLAFFRGVGFLPAIREHGPDHLHVHFATFASFLTMSLAERTGIPYSLTIHATGIFQEKKLITEKCERAKFVAAISKFNRSYLKVNFKVPEERIRIVHCGIVPAQFETVAGSRKAPTHEGPRTIRIFSIGRLVEKKGFPVLMEALGMLKEDDRWTMVLAGSGPHREGLEDLAAELGLADRVEFQGRISSEKLVEELGKADLFVLPCVVASNGDMDGIPVVLMEALACAIPTISTEVSGIPELIENRETGLLVRPGKAEALAEAIRTLMDDPDLARKLGKNGTEKVREEFDISRTTGELYDLIQNG